MLPAKQNLELNRYQNGELWCDAGLPLLLLSPSPSPLHQMDPFHSPCPSLPQAQDTITGEGDPNAPLDMEGKSAVCQIL
jgi:hypothetical protein